MRIVYIIINLNPKKKKQKELLIKLTADSFSKNLIIDLFENNLHYLLTKTKLMKKKLSLFLAAFIALTVFTVRAAIQANDPVTLTWDFSEYEESVGLIGDDYKTTYRGLELVGNQSATDASKEFVQAGKGFHMNGSSNASRRYIKYTPEYDGKMTVTFISNNSSSTDRIVAIATEVATFKKADVDDEKVPGSVLAYGYSEGYTEKTINADLTAGTDYYIYFADGGQAIMKLEYVYTPAADPEPDPEPVATKTIYLKPGEWTADNARFAAWAWGEGQDAAWYDLTVVEGATDYYEVAVPETTSGIVFVRMNPASSENIWDNAWNQTEDLEIGQNNLFKITGWGPQGGKSTCEPGTYPEEPTPPAEDVYTVAGAFYNSETAQGVFFGEPWTLLEANNMVKGADGSETTYIKTYQDAELEAGNIQFKVYKNNNWNEGYPENNYELLVTKAGKYDLTITFNSDSKEITAQLTSKTPIYTIIVPNWKPSAGLVLTVTSSPAKYSVGSTDTVPF